MRLGGLAARGVLWTLVEYGGGEAISFLVFLVLARVVSPSGFGLVSLALVCISFVQLLLTQGFADAVIQRAEIDDAYCSTAFWGNLAIALAAALLILGLAPPIAALFREPGLVPVLRCLAPLPLATALISIHQAQLKRRLEFVNFAKRAIVATAAGGLAGIAMALAGFGVWSLVVQQLTNAAVSVLVLWTSCEWRPRFLFSRRALGDLVRFSGGIIGGNLLAFVYKKTDVWLVGYFFGAQQLGYYYLVQRLLITMGLVTQSAIQAIVMPVLSRVQHDRARFREIFAKAVQFLNALWAPLALGAGAVAPLLLPTVFGAKWQPAVPLLEIISLAGFTEAFTLYTAPALTASGRPALTFKLSLAQFVITPAVLLPLAHFGVAGIAAGFVLVAASIVPLHLAVLAREGIIAPGTLLGRCAGPSLAAALMAAGVVALKMLLAPRLPPALALALLVAAGAVLYGGALALFARPLVGEMIQLAAAGLGRERRAASPAEGGVPPQPAQ